MIGQHRVTGQRNDTIVDSLEANCKTLNYRQPNNKSSVLYLKGLKEIYDTTIEIGGHGAFRLKPFREAINEVVGNGMTLIQYLDTTLNTAAHVANKTALEESYKQKVLDRLLALNCRHKSVKNDIQRTQTHERPDANGVVPSS